MEPQNKTNEPAPSPTPSTSSGAFAKALDAYRSGNPAQAHELSGGNDWYSGVQSGAYRTDKSAGNQDLKTDNSEGQPDWAPKGGILGSEKGFGQSIADALFSGKATEINHTNIMNHANDIQKLSEKMQEMKKAGQDTTHVEQTLKTLLNEDPSHYGGNVSDIIPSVNKSKEQIIGEAGGVLTDLFTAAGGLSPATAGAAFGLTHALQSDKGVGGALVDTAIGALGGKVLQFGFDKFSPYISKVVSRFGAPILEKLASVIPKEAIPALEKLAAKATIGTGTGGTEVLNKVNAAVEKPFSATANAVSKAGSAVKTKAQSALESKYTKQSQADWTKPTENPSAQYRGAKGVFDREAGKGHNVAETLVKEKIPLADNITGGKYNTEETANAIRESTAKFSHDTIRPSLEMADYSEPKTPLEDVVTSAKKNINSDKSLTAGNKKTLLKNLEEERQALEEKYPEGMSLTDMHDEKITYGSNTKRDMVTGNVGTNNEATKNEAFRDAFKNIVETKAEKHGIPVGEFNKELGKRFSAADYLDALHGKKVPTGLKAYVAKKAGQVAGLALGKATGGGILADVIGYQAGGAIENTFQNMSNPLKAMVLNNLKQTNKPAFEAMTKWLGEQEAERLSMKALPAGSKLGTEKNPIPMGGKTKEGFQVSPSGEKTPIPSPTKAVPATKFPTSQHPKSGKFQKTYSSSTVEKK